jgi:16S rRNA (guanine527-N7)-methyltransferase
MKGAGGLDRKHPMREALRQVLVQGINELGLPATPDQIDALLRFSAEIERWNPRCGLVKARGRDLIVRHVLDSLAGLRCLQELPRLGRIADVGSGAGFPGIPLSVFLPNSRFFLIERSERRAVFLESVIILLQLPNVHVIPQDLRSVKDRFDVVVLRAVKPLPEQWDNLLAVTRESGVIAAYKGRIEPIREEIARLETSASEAGSSGRAAGGRRGIPLADVEIIPLRVPFLQAERHLVLFRLGAQT